MEPMLRTLLLTSQEENPGTLSGKQPKKTLQKQGFYP